MGRLLFGHDAIFTVGEALNSLHLTIRPAQSSDLRALVDILFTSFEPRSGLMRCFSSILRLGLYEDLRQSLRSVESNQCVYLVATISPSPELLHQATIVGAVEITFSRTLLFGLSDSYHPYLSNFAVRLDYRRQGIGRRLLQACEETVRERGFNELYLHVLRDNYPARQLYHGAGYCLKRSDPFWKGLPFQRSQRLLLYKSITVTAG
jgi:ribosomal protein S18 acetylase RimI-like enzyme